MYFPSLSESAGVRDALQLNPEAGALLSAFHEVLLRGPSPLSPAERELVAAYVSGLNNCLYCHETHRATAVCFGVSGDALVAMVEDPDLAAAPERLRPLLRFARKLTLAQNSMTDSDVADVYAAGWDERGLHDLILVVATFNFMNRFVHGHGIEGSPEQRAASGRYLFENGYSGIVSDQKQPAPSAAANA